MERSVRDYATQDFVQLGETMRVEEALRFIRDRPSTGQTLIYFYVVGRLIGSNPVFCKRARCLAHSRTSYLPIS